jgi:hypothetical protein
VIEKGNPRPDGSGCGMTVLVVFFVAGIALLMGVVRD